jgi:hypothetical protein
MKTTIKLSILALIAAITFISCGKETIKGSGPRVSEFYANSNFSKVDLRLSDNLIYSHDTLNTVRIIAKNTVKKEVKEGV